MEFKNGRWNAFRPPSPDANLQKFRYDSVYIPGSDKNVVSPMLSMKYNLSKENIKLQNQFEQRLVTALMEETAERKPIHF